MLNSDVFCFSETHLQTCFNYSIIEEKYEVGEVFGEKQKNKGRAAMGFIVGWKKDVFTKSNFVIENQHVIRLELTQGINSWTIFFVYFPPYQYIDDKCVEFFDSLEKYIRKDRKFIVSGDFNGRIGSEEIELKSRNSKDLTVNRRGGLIISKVRWLGLNIGNGCTQGDHEGEFTFIQRNGKSYTVCDYCFYKGYDDIDFKVESLTHSDHFPISCKFKTTNLLQSDASKNDNQKPDVFIQRFPNVNAKLDFMESWSQHIDNLHVCDDSVEGLNQTSRAHWLLARLTLNEQNLKPAKLSMIHKFFDVWQVFRM